MLSEHFIAAISTPAKAPNTSVTKDAGIFVHELLPLSGQRSIFKKSAVAQNCLAVSEWHVFAAQEGKAVVHVYNREKGNQEALIPFQEQITCLSLACGDSVLILGTESGRLLLWEVCTGRLVSTRQSHLQAVSCLSVDPTSNFLLSGSADSNVHVWSITALLSFAHTDSSVQTDPRSPIHTLSNHRGAITALAYGHGHGAANIVVSISVDSTAIIWDYRKGAALRTYLLGDVPRAVILDAIDRAFYVAYHDGTLQLVDMYKSTGTLSALYDETQAQTAAQPGEENRWTATAQELGPGLSLGLSWDGSRIISGHQSGKIAAWDPGKGRFLSTLNSLPGPVSNLVMLPPAGFPNTAPTRFKVHTVVKPRFDLVDTSSGNGSSIPGNYTFTAQFTSQLSPLPLSATETPSKSTKSDFDSALTHSSFPASMLDAGLAELASWHTAPILPAVGASASNGTEETDFISFEDTSEANAGKRGKPGKTTPQQENDLLKKQVASLQRVQKISFKQLADSRAE
ncbi:WD domain-containing protein [Tothia fuscella]|uniref:Pre-rRNA-processing protein IPI3 n=1 Tax=Tothia fuscella TaxID=1048955 RepID=A0A9P4P1L7_9PEZI|nr:WD domain-containing protein [Tothia fuscella]